MEFFTSAINILKTLVVAIGAGLAVWGVINLLEGYGNDNPGAKMSSVILIFRNFVLLKMGTLNKTGYRQFLCLYLQMLRL